MAILNRCLWEVLVVAVIVLVLGHSAHSTLYADALRICQRPGMRLVEATTCNTYFMCFAGMAVLHYCPRGTQFDPDTGRCITIGYDCRRQVLYGNHIVETKDPAHGEQMLRTPRGGHGEDIVNQAMSNVKSLMRSEANMARRMEGVIDSGPYRYVSAFLYAKPIAKKMSHSAHVLMEAHKLRLGLPGADLKVLRPSTMIGVPDARQIVSSEMNECPYPKTFNCDRSSRFRTIDGSCNNLQRPILGRSNVAHRRLVKPKYGNGIDTMRVSVRGGPLPSARDISRHLFIDMNHTSHIHTLHMMTWGQFKDHDLTRTAISRTTKDQDGSGETVEVKCGYDGCQKDGEGLEACWPIPVSVEDPDFGHTNRCIKFVRSEATPPLDCRSPSREQVNQVTPWLDASNVYGSTTEEAEAVRELSNADRGKLKMRLHPDPRQLKSLLPIFDDEQCRGTNHTVRCFLAGDNRVNENSALTAMHTVWVREHNHLEEQLHNINPHWSGERLYQEARRVVMALMQNVLINEQVPLVLGQELAASYDLTPTTNDYYYGYSSRFDPRITQSFATAAYRFGHSMIQEHFTRIHENGKGHGQNLLLSHSFFRPGHIYDGKQGGIDAILRGLGSQGSQTSDRFFTKQISRSLFTERPPHGPGMDLLALNIQRGRDHGMPSYNEYRQFCGLDRVTTFDELAKDVTDINTVSILKRVYRHPDDIDLFAGGIIEKPVPGGMVGPTFGCILGDQFRGLRRGDRFWFENKNRFGFTPAQLEEIRKMRLSKVICTNGDNVDTIQPWVMLIPLSELNQRELDDATYQKFYAGHGNEHVHCTSLPDLNMREWREY